jgi:hypothetical protein
VTDRCLLCPIQIFDQLPVLSLSFTTANPVTHQLTLPISALCFINAIKHQTLVETLTGQGRNVEISFPPARRLVYNPLAEILASFQETGLVREHDQTVVGKVVVNGFGVLMAGENGEGVCDICVRAEFSDPRFVKVLVCASVPAVANSLARLLRFRMSD